MTVKAMVFAFAIIFVFWYGLLPMFSEKVALTITLMIAAWQIGGWAAILGKKVFPHNTDSEK
jgi:hypothetical protein